MREEILEILEEIRPDVDFESETSLIDGGVLDSMDIVAIVGEFNDAFDVKIGVEKLVPDNFNSVDGMIKLIESLEDED
ncbi:MAG: acyl carrier protein [Oscillospiraceae bacterium]|nr:acyl carrier protein [Candidatus Ruminococcus equi]